MLSALVWYSCLIFAPTICLAAQFSCSAISNAEACLPTWFVVSYFPPSLPESCLLPGFICRCLPSPGHRSMLTYWQVSMRKSNHNAPTTPHGFPESCRGWNHFAHDYGFFIDLPVFFGLRWVLQLCYTPKSGNLRRQRECYVPLPDPS